MKQCHIRLDVLHNIWNSLEDKKDRPISVNTLDRYLSIYYGIIASSEYFDEEHRETHYPCYIRDEKLYILFLLRHS